MAARLDCRHVSRQSKNLGKKPQKETGFRRRNLLCSWSHKTFYIGSAEILKDMPEREKTLTINEIYHSIQGESTWTGWPCVFVRLTFCDLRCNYCDTEYAFYEGKKRSLDEILHTVAEYSCPLVEITGGEPLLQKNVLPLMSMLCDSGYTVLLETSGAHVCPTRFQCRSRRQRAWRTGVRSWQI